MQHKQSMVRSTSARGSIPSRISGFNLLELMIVVVVVGILAAIAYPSYRDHVRKSNRSAAQSYMLSLSSRQEQLMLDRRSYVAATTHAALAASPINFGVPDEVSRNYTIRVDVTVAPPGYTITAAPVATGPQSGDANMTLNNQGVRLPASYWK